MRDSIIHAMTMDDYQEQACKTVVYHDKFETTYPVLGLMSEAGEVAGVWKKALRDHDGFLTVVNRQAIVSELGDVLWYVAVLAKDLGYDLSYLAQKNIDKLADRQARGKLSGSGDNR